MLFSIIKLLLLILMTTFSNLLSSSIGCDSHARMDISKSSIGFIGCGKISSAVCRGYAGLDNTLCPKKLLVTRRSEEKSRELLKDFPSIIEIVEDAKEIVERCDIIFIGLLPGVARTLLPSLPFAGNKIVISMMAAVDTAELLSLVGVASTDSSSSSSSSSTITGNVVVRTVPLPSAMRRSGPILMFPPNTIAESVLRIVGTPIVCQTEAEMKPMISLTGHISSFYELMGVTEQWIIKSGVQDHTARRFVSSFYQSMASAADNCEDSFEELSIEAATPGGLNEQSLGFLRQSEHFSLQEQSLQAILNRLSNRK